MLKYFHDNKLGLNLGKSGYLIINAKSNDMKTNIHIENGCLEYKNQVVYLGGVFSDTGKLIMMYLCISKKNDQMSQSNLLTSVQKITSLHLASNSKYWTHVLAHHSIMALKLGEILKQTHWKHSIDQDYALHLPYEIQQEMKYLM